MDLSNIRDRFVEFDSSFLQEGHIDVRCSFEEVDVVLEDVWLLLSKLNIIGIRDFKLVHAA